MATVTNNPIITSPSGDFDFTPVFDTDFVAEFGPGHLICVPSSGDCTIDSCDPDTGQIIGNVTSAGVALCYWTYVPDEGAERDAGQGDFEISTLSANYSLNPIVASVTTGAPNQRTEIEVFAETQNNSATFVSLGTFSLTSDAAGEIVERIDALLHAWLLTRIDPTLPDALDAVQEDPTLACRFYYRSRYYTSGAWTSWVNADQGVVLYGGRALEEVTAGNLSLDYMALTPMVPVFLSYALPSYIYFLTRSGSVAEHVLTLQYYNLDGTADTVVTRAHTPANIFEVVRFLVDPPTEDQDHVVTATFGDGATISASLIYHRSPRQNTYEFRYLNSRGGWAYLSCASPITRIIDVNQQTAETILTADYYVTNRLQQYKPFNLSGRKKIKVSTGYMLAIDLEVLIQDFMLSPLKYVFNTDLQKWLPIILNTKSMEYQDDDQQLRSASFEFQYAFDNNLPSWI